MDGRSANHSQSNGFHTQSQEPGAEHAGRLTEPGCPRWVLAVVAGVGRRLRAAADVRRRRRRRWLRGHGQPGVVRVHAQRLDTVQHAGAVAARRCSVRFLHRQHRAETPSCNTQRTAGLVALARVDSHPHAHAREGEGGRRELRLRVITGTLSRVLASPLGGGRERVQLARLAGRRTAWGTNGCGGSGVWRFS